jgi:hypothetical protein
MKIITSFVLGGAVASVVFIWIIIPRYAKDQFALGYGPGYIAAQSDILGKIPSALGTDYLESDGYHPLFEVKSSAAVVVERNGAKTLRVYPR